MFGGNSPRRQSVPGYPGYHQPAGSTAAGYDYAGVSGAAHVYADQQWSGYHHLYGRYDDWNHHAAAAAVAAAQFQQSPSSPGASLDTETSTSTSSSLLYNYNKPVTSSLCPPAVSGDFKPPLFGDPRSVSGGEESVIPGSRVTAGHDHHSPDSGLAASDGVSGSDSPSHGQHPAQPVTADTDSSSASSSGQDNVSSNVSTAPEQVTSDASSAEDSREAVPVDTEEEGRTDTEEDNNTATDNKAGHSKEVAVDNVESSQDTQQSSSSR